MASTLSVSKGVFLFKNGAKAASKSSRSRKRPKGGEDAISDCLWYKSYKSIWNSLSAEIQDLNHEMFAKVLNNLVIYIADCYQTPVTEIPSAALLTGINMPDHSAQFKILKKTVKLRVTPHVAVLSSENCQNLKHLVENMINQLVTDGNESSDEDSDSEILRVKKSECSFSLLQNWYEELYVTRKPPIESPTKRQKTRNNKKIILVIISDFESFNDKVLQNFILIASSYINVLPFVFVFGVATSVTALHHSLPYQVSSKVRVQVFNSPPATAYLNNVLETVLFSKDCPFHLGGKVFNLLTDIFLFYDFSVSGFIQNFKYAMLEHFTHGNAMALCKIEGTSKVLSHFTHDDFENARHLASFRSLVENEPDPKKRIKLLTDDQYFRNVLQDEIAKIQQYLQTLPLFLKCLHVLVSDLPKYPLGKQIREMYSLAVSKNITKTPEYQESFQLLGFQSQEELCRKIDKIAGFLVNNNVETKGDREAITALASQLQDYVRELGSLQNGTEVDEGGGDVENVITGQMARLQLKTALLKLSRNKTMNKYEKLREKILKFLSQMFETYLKEPSSFYFHEIFFFNDISIQSHVVGAHRAAIHAALNDPQSYLQCSCCTIADDSIILTSMPDISIAYKLHLECGKMINLYDWLQAFLTIVDPQDIDDDSQRVVNPELQARFTQAVAELEYLGFVKSSKRKTDHVARLTWGG